MYFSGRPFTRAIALSLFLPMVCVYVAVAPATAANSHKADVVVYGDASGGVTAAVQAARMGKKVILVSPYGHLGGLTSSGLGWTDIGNNAILGGLSREFYHGVYKHYQNDAAWNHQARHLYNNKRHSPWLFQPMLHPYPEWLFCKPMLY